MRKKKPKEQHIGENNSIEMKNSELIPNESYANFIIGDNINKYLHLPYTLEANSEDSTGYDSYNFHELGLTLWVEECKIVTIRCAVECYWHCKNLIGLPFTDFLVEINQQPDNEESFYVLISENRGRNQKVYTFYNLGLMVWVWRKKIETILISRYD